MCVSFQTYRLLPMFTPTIYVPRQCIFLSGVCVCRWLFFFVLSLHSSCIVYHNFFSFWMALRMHFMVLDSPLTSYLLTHQDFCVEHCLCVALGVSFSLSEMDLVFFLELLFDCWRLESEDWIGWPICVYVFLATIKAINNWILFCSSLRQTNRFVHNI